MQQGLSRRAFLGSAIGLGALAVPIATSGAAAAPTSTLYWLNPDWGAGDPACVPNHGQTGCGGCYACVAHYQNKLFATYEAADAGRAHPRCRCLVQEAFTVDPATYGKLFENGDAVDRRTPGVNALLAQSTTPPVPAGSHGSSGTGAAASPTTASAAGNLAFTGASILPLAVAGVGAVAVGAALVRGARTRPDPSPD